MALSSHVSRILVGDYSLSGVTRSVTPSYSAMMLDASCLPDQAKVFVPGMNTSTLAVAGVLDTSGASDAEIDQVFDWTGAEAVTVAPEGLGVGSNVWLCSAEVAKFTPSASVGDLVVFSLDLQTDGPTDIGVSLVDLGALTAATNGTAVDNGAASTGGGVGHLHVTAYSGFTNCTVKVQHSTDNFAADTTDLITFSTVTGITQQRSTVSGSVSRYVRFNFAKSGTGSATIQVGFARR